MKIRKYIISNGELIQGLVEYHNELTKKDPGGKVTGGGIVYFDEDDKKLYLYGSSLEYGTPKIEEVKESIKKASASIRGVDVYWSPMPSLSDVFREAEKIWTKPEIK